MKHLHYTCDGRNCKSSESDIQKWITIGSKTGAGLQVNSGLPNRQLISLDNHSDIHFCSDYCFISYFINNNK